MFNRPWFIRSIVTTNVLTCLEAELSDYFLRIDEETRILENYKNNTVSTRFCRKEWFMNEPFTHDVLFHLNSKSSVTDPGLRIQLLRESKKAAPFKDFFTFLLLGVFMPRTSLIASGFNLAKNVSLNFDIRNERCLAIAERAEIGKYCRLLFVCLPFAAFLK